MEDIEFAAFLVSRVCHDLVGPLGAVVNGLEVMDELNQIAEASYLPILMLTGDDTPEAKRETLYGHAMDELLQRYPADNQVAALTVQALLTPARRDDFNGVEA